MVNKAVSNWIGVRSGVQTIKKESDMFRNSLKTREPMTRFELVTSSLPRKRSTPELYRQFDQVNVLKIGNETFERETRVELATFSLEG